jgi:hypothetical protein
MSNVVQLPMRWMDAYRLVGNELGLSADEIIALIDEALTHPEAEQETWLSGQLLRAARKKMMRQASP